MRSSTERPHGRPAAKRVSARAKVGVRFRLGRGRRSLRIVVVNYRWSCHSLYPYPMVSASTTLQNLPSQCHLRTVPADVSLFLQEPIRASLFPSYAHSAAHHNASPHLFICFFCHCCCHVHLFDTATNEISTTHCIFSTSEILLQHESHDLETPSNMLVFTRTTLQIGDIKCVIPFFTVNVHLLDYITIVQIPRLRLHSLNSISHVLTTPSAPAPANFFSPSAQNTAFTPPAAAFLIAMLRKMFLTLQT